MSRFFWIAWLRRYVGGKRTYKRVRRARRGSHTQGCKGHVCVHIYEQVVR